jgi:hypothetical protein
MATGKMYECEVKTLFKIKGVRQWRWIVKPVTALVSGQHPDYRCMHCHGEVRVHKQQVDHGPGDHVEHMHRPDSEGCQGGNYFKGVHRLSQHPVV